MQAELELLIFQSVFPLNGYDYCYKMQQKQQQQQLLFLSVHNTKMNLILSFQSWSVGKIKCLFIGIITAKVVLV